MKKEYQSPFFRFQRIHFNDILRISTDETPSSGGTIIDPGDDMIDSGDDF